MAGLDKTISAGYWQSRIDHWLRQYGQAVGVWRQDDLEDPTGRPSDTLAYLVISTTALLLYGDDVAAEATIVGIEPNKAARGFFLSTAAPSLLQMDWIRDQDGNPWRVRSSPRVQDGPGTIGMACLLQRVADKPPGMT